MGTGTKERERLDTAYRKCTCEERERQSRQHESKWTIREGDIAAKTWRR